MKANIVYQDETGSGKVLIYICGRGGTQYSSLEHVRFAIRDGFKGSVITLWADKWYENPNGPDDQVDAIDSKQFSEHSLSCFIESLTADDETNPITVPVEMKNIHLIGHSAGAVLALSTVAKYNLKIGSVTSVAGCVLDPSDEIPKTRQSNECEFVFIHSKDDPVFKFQERFLPTLESFKVGYKNVTYIDAVLTKDHHSFTELTNRVYGGGLSGSLPYNKIEQ